MSTEATRGAINRNVMKIFSTPTQAMAAAAMKL
jgi:hypothetical protein